MEEGISVLEGMLKMACDLKEGESFDYVVVGTGPMSGPVIRRLVDAGHTVLVLEKGPYFNSSSPDQKAQGDNFDDEFKVSIKKPGQKKDLRPPSSPDQKAEDDNLDSTSKVIIESTGSISVPDQEKSSYYFSSSSVPKTGVFQLFNYSLKHVNTSSYNIAEGVEPLIFYDSEYPNAQFRKKNPEDLQLNKEVSDFAERIKLLVSYDRYNPNARFIEKALEDIQIQLNKTSDSDSAYAYAQLQGFGGQTLTYGGLSLRASLAAFDKWPNITFDKMLEWYMKSEAFTWACGNVPTASESHSCRNFSGFMSVLLQDENAYPKIVGVMPSFCAAGVNGTKPLWLDTTGNTKIDYNGLHPTRAFCGPPQVFLNQTTTSSGEIVYERGSLQQTYLPYEYIQSHKNLLKVCVNTTVDRLILNEEATQVVGAKIESPDCLIIKGKQFVLASGTRFSPQLLMKSGIGDSASLGALGVKTKLHLPDVGRHFHDEWAFSVSFKITSPNASDWVNTDSKLNRDQMHLVKWATGAQGDNFTDVQLYLRLGNSLTQDKYLPKSFRIGIPAKDHDSFAIRVALFQNDTFGSTSGVFPTGSNGHYVNKFKFSVDMFNDNEKLDRFVRGAVEGYNKAMELVELMTTQSLNGERLNLTAIDSTDALIKAANNGTLAFIEALVDWGNVLALHGGGTCGIGRVTDSDLKVYNLSNLYIGDMSVFPYPVDANPTATLFALGERLAAHLLSLPTNSAVPSLTPSPTHHPYNPRPSLTPYTNPEVPLTPCTNPEVPFPTPSPTHHPDNPRPSLTPYTNPEVPFPTPSPTDIHYSRPRQ
jgi:choline dehydrogenase-like flavoprotein